MSIFHLFFGKVQKNFDSTMLSFSIGNIKSRTASVAYVILHCYDYKGHEIFKGNKAIHIGKRFVITGKYREHVEEIYFSAENLAKTYQFEVELVVYGITSENPLWFNNVMLETGSHEEYHKPDEAFDESDVVFKNNNYCVLYTNGGHGMQVIRPEQDKITTKKLLRSKYTILAPHLDNEPTTDTPDKLMMEFVNQTEQYITIQK